ncbi:D-sedoheptulose-7-phosphate isomerase [Paenibacillus cymbidii]|uniref:D-sedoheptulose-7-phosphate isomerase n=1 Tax=Paenibacillus cymbidii TaxID=1639034 RepID=UPI0010805820|nr:SIS domain-containing protein [Paenibacillus cymbidii]
MHHVLKTLIGRYPELDECAAQLEEAYAALVSSYRAGGQLLVCGNGGSASDSEHIVGELMKGFMLKRPLGTADRDKLAAAFPEEGDYLANHLQGALPAISLVSHSALITAYSNDVAPDMIFAQQVYGYGQPGDVVLGISTSGNSGNVVRAIQVGKAMGLRTICLTGRKGGKLGALCDVAVRVPSDSTPDIQELHLPIYHALCVMLEEEFFGQ